MGFTEGTNLLKFNAKESDDQVITVLVINDQFQQVLSLPSQMEFKAIRPMERKFPTESAATVCGQYLQINNLDQMG